jgi:hypothetical protein
VFEFNFYHQASFIGSSQMAFGTWFVNKTVIYNVHAWIVGKKYGIKNLIVGSTNVIATYMQLQPSIYAILT